MDAFGLESESIDNGVHYEMTRSSGWGLCIWRGYSACLLADELFARRFWRDES